MERLADLPDGTVVDGELVAIDDSGRPDFHLLQNFRAEASRIQYHIFDLLCCKDRDLTCLPLIERRVLLNAGGVMTHAASAAPRKSRRPRVWISRDLSFLMSSSLFSIGGFCR